MKTIEMTHEQIDAIVVSELQEAYRLNLIQEYDEGGYPIGRDEELLDALERVLCYFMPVSAVMQFFEDNPR